MTTDEGSSGFGLAPCLRSFRQAHFATISSPVPIERSIAADVCWIRSSDSASAALSPRYR